MSKPTPRDILKLYRDLIRYSKNLNFTDKDYFLFRVQDEFRKNQQIGKPEAIEFCYKVCEWFIIIKYFKASYK